jgi:RNA polymerase sigma-70 factor (ECF subfamily)
MPPPLDISAQITRLIREDWGRLLAVLVSFGGDFALAEDSLQDAMVAALEVWPKGLPKDPDAWLITTARRKAIDRLRRAQTAQDKSDALALWHWQHAPETQDLTTLPDHRLELIFTCCHPALDEKSRVALTLRALGGLTTAEIAAAFLDKPETMAARLTRGRKKIAAAGIRFRLPDPEDLPERIQGVLQVIYLIFNEGYRGSSGTYTRTDLSNEAIRLGRILSQVLPDHAETKGLLALMLLTESRRLARTDATGALVPLETQNRARWDQALIHEGLTLVETALCMAPAQPFTIQAAINALHARARNFRDTDWAQIVALYDILAQRQPNPVLHVNRAVALSYAASPDIALRDLDASGAARHLETYQPFHACRADLLARLGQTEAALAAYTRAIALSPSDQEAEFLRTRRAQLAP